MATKERKKTIDIIFSFTVLTIIGISIIISFITFVYVQRMSQDLDVIRGNLLTEKTNNYDEGSLSFFNNKIEATKKDYREGDYLKGELVNKSGQRITEATIYFKLYDNEGNIVDLLTDKIKAWDSGEKWIYSMSLSKDTSAKYEFAGFDISY